MEAARPRAQGGSAPAESCTAHGGDSLLYVVDWSEIEAFDPRTGVHLGAYRMPRPPATIAVSSGRLFAGYADPRRNGSVARVTGDSAGLRVTGSLPELLRDAALFPMVNPVALGMKGDTAATAFVVTDLLYLSDAGGAVLDSIRVPVRRRNGARPDLLRRLSRDPADQELGEAAIYGSSIARGLHWLPGGRIALVSADWRVVRERFVDSSYVSVVDPRPRRSCVDARVPGPTDPPVRVGLRGDTLFVVAQEVGEGTRASTVVRWYRIDTGAAAGWASDAGSGLERILDGRVRACPRLRRGRASAP